MIENNPNMPIFDKSKNWQGIQSKVKRRFYKQVSAVSALLIILVSTTMFINTNSPDKLYSNSGFDKIVAMEDALEAELSSMQKEVVEFDDNPRYVALIEQVSNINSRLAECKDEMLQNPLNPNFHRVYVSLLKSKRKALELLNEMKG